MAPQISTPATSNAGTVSSCPSRIRAIEIRRAGSHKSATLDFEYQRDFAVRWRQQRPRRGRGDDRVQPETADRNIQRRQRAEDAHMLGRERDFLLRLAQGGPLERFARLGAPPGSETWPPWRPSVSARTVSTMWASAPIGNTRSSPAACRMCDGSNPGGQSRRGRGDISACASPPGNGCARPISSRARTSSNAKCTMQHASNARMHRCTTAMRPSILHCAFCHYGFGTTDISGQLVRGGGYGTVVAASTTSEAMNAYPASLG